MMREIKTIEELKKIQLDLLLAFHLFCGEHNIKYSLAAGTLIGAVRHKGFIPWDDDIDVYLLRDEYNRLLELCPSVLNGCGVLVSKERDCKWNRAYAKFYDNRTLMIERTKNRYCNLGVGIDVFPIDDVPDDQNKWEQYNRKRMLLRDIVSAKSFMFSRKRNVFKTFFILVCQLLLLPFSLKKLVGIMNKYSQKNNGKGYSHVYENCLGVYNSKYAWLKKDIEEVVDAPFEGHQVKIMKGYDDYLTKVYGNYMQLPPIEKRVSHHSFEAYWK